MTRLHAPTLEVVVREQASSTTGGPAWQLSAPAPGWFSATPRTGAWLAPGDVLGTLAVLGRNIALVIPAPATGVLRADLAGGRPLATPRAVGHGDPLAVLDASGGGLGDVVAPTSPATVEGVHRLVFRAPTSGRYYGRPSPDKPPFVVVGDELGTGTTICLLEVMKTFNRVTYGGAALPDRARVTALLVADGADVLAGDPLLALE